MNRLKHALFKDGRITFVGSIVLLLLGLLVGYASLVLLPSNELRLIGASVGLGISVLGGFSGRARALGLPPPFTNDPLGWRKAKRTYESPDDSDEPEHR